MEFFEEVFEISNYSLIYTLLKTCSIYMKCINKINEIRMSILVYNDLY